MFPRFSGHEKMVKIFNNLKFNFQCRNEYMNGYTVSKKHYSKVNEWFSSVTCTRFERINGIKFIGSFQIFSSLIFLDLFIDREVFVVCLKSLKSSLSGFVCILKPSLLILPKERLKRNGKCYARNIIAGKLWTTNDPSLGQNVPSRSQSHLSLETAVTQ